MLFYKSTLYTTHLPRLFRYSMIGAVQVIEKLRSSFLRMWFNCFKAAEPLQGDNLLFTTKSSSVTDTHLI